MTSKGRRTAESPELSESRRSLKTLKTLILCSEMLYDRTGTSHQECAFKKDWSILPKSLKMKVSFRDRVVVWEYRGFEIRIFNKWLHHCLFKIGSYTIRSKPAIYYFLDFRSSGAPHLFKKARWNNVSGMTEAFKWSTILWREESDIRSNWEKTSTHAKLRSKAGGEILSLMVALFFNFQRPQGIFFFF